jgi:hypothetical protein
LMTGHQVAYLMVIVHDTFNRLLALTSSTDVTTLFS